MLSAVFVLLLVGGCAGLQRGPARSGRYHQKSMNMTTVFPSWTSTRNSGNGTMSTWFPSWNATSNMPVWNMTTAQPGNVTFPSWNTTSDMPVWNMTTTPWWNSTSPGNVTMMSTTMTTTSLYNVTDPWNITTPTPIPGNGSCGGIIFIEQMTKEIMPEKKTDFFNVTRALAAQLHSQGKWTPYSYAYAQYGSTVYRGINVTDYFDFVRNLDQAEYNFTTTNKPNGGYTYLSPILTEVLNYVSNFTNQRLSILLMGEDSSLRDPANAYSLAQSISYYNANIYVLDYSQGAIPLSIWPTLTGNKAYHIVNGNGLSQEDIVDQFEGTLLNDVLDGIC
ncbi:hypothetical protein FO519_004666 [Halicephalobus sp. NKZ332]|nr:hypothetical protein FO519_004666 [Halicephalobus sp. NKZ332]